MSSQQPCSTPGLSSGTGKRASFSPLSLIREENIPMEISRGFPLIIHQANWVTLLLGQKLKPGSTGFSKVVTYVVFIT